MVLALFALAGTLGRAAAQHTALKWNALYWAVGVPNMSVETRIGERFTFNADAVYSPWKSIKGRPMLGLQLIPEVRFYPRAAFRGFYVGAYVSYDSYKVSKWDHPKTDVQHGIGLESVPRWAGRSTSPGGGGWISTSGAAGTTAGTTGSTPARENAMRRGTAAASGFRIRRG